MKTVKSLSKLMNFNEVQIDVNNDIAIFGYSKKTKVFTYLCKDQLCHNFLPRILCHSDTEQLGHVTLYTVRVYISCYCTCQL